jgi:ribosomal protein L17
MADKQQENNKAVGKRASVGRPFKKGQSGNPAGRPKSLTLSEAYRRELAKIDPHDALGRTFAEVLAEQMIVKASKGDVAALREIADRVEGKAKQTITLTTDRREQVERAIERMIEKAAEHGQTLARQEAITALAAYVPEASQLIH